ncbi:MAG TPA: carboxypeptidase regulatory-like domain-containing protein [Pyrinomonadaceae bacterium]|nr:carboxypeptidase regulatory-like domain-containing protein [Acidobacteriota bacterium]HQZ96245.1 carboxypeptidase regulatory-like domain-containing protein [Pyrinomonadaceae bacterium]
MNFFGKFFTVNRLALLAIAAFAISATVVMRPEATKASDDSPLGGRTLTVVSTSGQAGTPVTVSIELDSQGDEVASSFSLNFDPAILSNPVVALGSGVPAGSNLSVNLNQAATGRIGILVDSTNPFLVSPPNRQVITVTFNIAANAPTGATAITFVTTPTPLSISSALGALLPAVYQVGTVTVTPPAVSFVTIGGKVTTPAGQNLRNVTVNLIDSNNVRRVATTSSFGIYSFANVATGQSYTLTVTSKRYRFSPRIETITASVSNLDFVGLE